MGINVAIVDYGMGNLHSVYRKLTQLQVRPVIATNAMEILKADKIILPGVGHFASAIRNLKQSGAFDALNEAVLVNQRPVLGICLGMQLMGDHSAEGDAAGFGWFSSKVVKFNIQDKLKYKVPQIGWNTIKSLRNSSLLKNLNAESEFYFLHSYHFGATEPAYVLAQTEFEYWFVSAVEKGNIFGTQFHPEKSYDAGNQLLKNFIRI